MTLHITCAAVKDTDGGNWHLQPPNRHHNVMALMNKAGLKVEEYGEQGFLDSDGRFQGREEAFKIASAAGQVTLRRPGPKNYQGPELFSEDMW